MAVAFDAVGAGANANATSLSWSHTIAAGASIVVPVALGGYFSGISAPSGWTRSVTCGGVAMTVLGSMQGNNTASYPFVEVWGLLVPPTGAQTIAVSYVNAANTPYLTGNSVSYTGVGSFDTPVYGYSNSTAISSGAVTSATGNMVIAAQQVWANTGTATISAPSGTSRSNFGGTINTYPSLLVQDVAGASTNTLTSTSSLLAFWGSVAINLKVPIVVAPPSPNAFFSVF